MIYEVYVYMYKVNHIGHLSKVIQKLIGRAAI